MTDNFQETPEGNHRPELLQQRLCDYCDDKTAVLYCRADSAKLCLSCDREVHSTNQLFSKHSRSQLCDGCGASPASIFCETEHSVLCSNCDWENHSRGSLSLSPIHNRRPIESFTGCPSVSELLTMVGFDDLDSKPMFMSNENRNDDNSSCVGDDGLSNLMLWDTPDFVSIDDLIVNGSDSSHNFQALDVPPLPKNRNAACGQHKEEMLCQLRQLAKSEPSFDPILGFQLLGPGSKFQPGNNKHVCSDTAAEPNSFPSNEANTFQWLNNGCDSANEFASPLSRHYLEENCMVPDKQEENDSRLNHAHDHDGYEGQSQAPITTEILPVLPKVGHHVHELNSQERDYAISRYKEKRKTRRYDKHIRYESRKARAETRTRIRGRFAKVER